MTTCNHCMGTGCIHCRERRAALSQKTRRSRLTPTERARLGLITRPLRLAPPFIPTATVAGAHRMTPVLPASFTLPTPA